MIGAALCARAEDNAPSVRRSAPPCARNAPNFIAVDLPDRGELLLRVDAMLSWGKLPRGWIFIGMASLSLERAPQAATGYIRIDIATSGTAQLASIGKSVGIPAGRSFRRRRGILATALSPPSAPWRRVARRRPTPRAGREGARPGPRKGEWIEPARQPKSPQRAGGTAKARFPFSAKAATKGRSYPPDFAK